MLKHSRASRCETARGVIYTGTRACWHVLVWKDASFLTRFDKGVRLSCVLGAIVAVTDEWAIGLAGDMVVANKADMRHFVEVTLGHPVIMGRKTLDSFPGGRPLKNRRNIVLTRDASFEREGVEVVHSIDEALELVSAEAEAWVIGGGELYRQMLPYCTVAEITKNHCSRKADTFFPNLDDDPCWFAASQTADTVLEESEGTPGLHYQFVTYHRKG